MKSLLGALHCMTNFIWFPHHILVCGCCLLQLTVYFPSLVSFSLCHDPTAALRLWRSLMSFYFVPQTSPDDVTDQIEGLTVTSKYKRTWVDLRQVEVQVYCPMKPLDVWNFSCLLIWKRNIHFSHGQFQRSFDKKAPPVSMSKLLSHGYVEDKKKSPNDDDCSSTILVSLPEGSCVICSKATAVSVSLCITWHSHYFPRCDLGTD